MVNSVEKIVTKNPNTTDVQDLAGALEMVEPHNIWQVQNIKNTEGKKLRMSISYSKDWVHVFNFTTERGIDENYYIIAKMPSNATAEDPKLAPAYLNVVS